MTRKPFHVQDHGLWDELARTIEPLGKRHFAVRPGDVLPRSASESRASTPQSAMPTRLPHGVAPPPLAGFDRRTAQRLSRGQMEPDARVDLHGESVELARLRLLHFISDARHSGARLVLVITGKGASPFARHTLHGHSHFHAPEREGRLRRELGHWLQEEGFRHHVVGFQPAHPRHGGGGAFYVRLRKLGGER